MLYANKDGILEKACKLLNIEAEAPIMNKTDTVANTLKNQLLVSSFDSYFATDNILLINIIIF